VHQADDVAVALRPLEPGTGVELGSESIALSQAIPHSHKFALRDIAQGEQVRKLGWPNGVANSGH
jgi:altronate hydrolase